MYGRRPRCKRNLTFCEAFGCSHVFGLFSRRGSLRLGPYRTKPTKRQRRMVAVAGAIAELSWQREFDEIDYDFDWCHDWWWDPAIMSESDWDLAGCGPGEPDKPFFTAIN